MYYNEETKKILVRSGFGWVIPLLLKKDGGKELTEFFEVKLIGLDILSFGPEGWRYHDDFNSWSRVFLFTDGGDQIAEVGGEREITRMDMDISWKWPFFFQVPTVYREDTFETVGDVIARLTEEEVLTIRYVVSIPVSACGSCTLKIFKLRKSDKSLRELLAEKVDEAVKKIEQDLQE